MSAADIEQRRWLLKSFAVGAVTRDPALSHGDDAVFWSIADRADAEGIAFPSLLLLAQDTKLTRQAVSNSVRRLVAHRYLEIVARGGPPKRVNRYRLTFRDAVPQSSQRELTTQPALTTQLGFRSQLGVVTPSCESTQPALTGVRNSSGHESTHEPAHEAPGHGEGPGTSSPAADSAVGPYGPPLSSAKEENFKRFRDAYFNVDQPGPVRAKLDEILSSGVASMDEIERQAGAYRELHELQQRYRKEKLRPYSALRWLNDCGWEANYLRQLEDSKRAKGSASDSNRPAKTRAAIGASDQVAETADDEGGDRYQRLAEYLAEFGPVSKPLPSWGEDVAASKQLLDKTIADLLRDDALGRECNEPDDPYDARRTPGIIEAIKRIHSTASEYGLLPLWRHAPEVAALAGWGHDLPAATRAFCIFAGHKAVVNDFDLKWTVYSESLSDVVALADALDAYARPAQERAA